MRTAVCSKASSWRTRRREVGATVFLGLAQNMRLTAIVFMLELSRLSTAFWLPVCVCMGVAMAVQMGWARRKAV